MSLKNRYALGSLDKRIDIFSLSDSTRYDFGPYLCYGCENELVPRLGKKNIWHFAHRTDVNCSPETYLHLVSKDIFYETFSQCIKKKKPYILSIHGIQYCSEHVKQFGDEEYCSEEYVEDINLIKEFDTIDMEKPYKNFIPDIMLSSTKHNKVLFIEIAVTHKCEENKINSGYKIIEFHIKKEKDLETLKDKKLNMNDKHLSIYNFELEKNINYCNGICPLREQPAKRTVIKAIETNFTHSEEGSKEILCGKCNVAYETIQTTSELEREEYGCDEYLKCPICGNSF